MDGLEGRRGKKMRQGGSKGEKGMTERGTGQLEGSLTVSQGNKPHHGMAAESQAAQQRQCVMWEKAWS